MSKYPLVKFIVMIDNNIMCATGSTNGNFTTKCLYSAVREKVRVIENEHTFVV